MKVAVEHTFTGPTELTSGTYDPLKTMIGSLMKQYTGPLSTDKYISIPPPLLSNNIDITGTALFMPHVYQWSTNIFWIFTATSSTASPITRILALHEYDSNLHTITWKGSIVLSGTTFLGNKVIRGLRSFITNHITGTVSTSGSSTTITGVNTLFQTQRIAVGARIGFGTTNPNEVGTWYEITEITSNTSLTINSPVTVDANTPYVIEEIRIAVLLTSSLLHNSGMFLIKGLNHSTFTLGGTVILEATTVDNIRASYFLKDKTPKTCTITIANPGVVTCNNHGFIAGDLICFSTTGTLPTGAGTNITYYVSATGLTANTFQFSTTLGGASSVTSVSQSGVHTLHSGILNIGMGFANDDAVDFTTDHLYALNMDNATNVKISKFNIRAELTVVGGLSADAFVYKTLSSTTVGTLQQVNNGRIFTVNHGSAAGIKSLFFVSSSRVYRCTLTDITDSSFNWISDQMSETPPGTVATNLPTNQLSQVDYSETLDRILISCTLAGRHPIYMTTYDTSGTPFERIFGQINNRTKLVTTPNGAPDALFNPGAMTLWTAGGRLFAIPTTATIGLNWMAVVNIGADGYYAGTTNQKVITPKLSTLNASQLYRAYLHTASYNGSYELGYNPEPVRLFYRTNGIDDNTGEWTETVTGDLSGVAPSDYIQFMLYLDVLGEFCMPNKIYAVACTYEDASLESQDRHYLSCADLSNNITKTFAWKHATAFGETVPRLKIRLFNAITDGILDTDDSVTQTGTWEKTIDGGDNWIAYNSTDKANEITFIRFTPASIPDNVQVKAILSLYA